MDIHEAATILVSISGRGVHMRQFIAVLGLVLGSTVLALIGAFSGDARIAEAQPFPCPPPGDTPLVKLDAVDPLQVGQTQTWTLTATNYACVAAAVVVTDTVPSSFGSVTASGAGWSCSTQGNAVTCSLPSLAPLSSSSPITIRSIALDCGAITNSANATFTFPNDPPPNFGFGTATTTIPCAAAAGHVTGGGQAAGANGHDQLAFGFNAKGDEGGTKGNCNVVDRAANVHIKCLDVTKLVVVGTHATIIGNATVNGVPTTYQIDIDDITESGRGSDTFRIQTASGYVAGGLLARGNVQVHK
jgi:uncharacterized repeat protein (TIGR01451 family)